MSNTVPLNAVRALATAATIIGGALAGGNIDRSLVQMPAWKRVGARRWAEYSQHADLERGLPFYPIEGIGGALLSIATAIALRRVRRVKRSAILAGNTAALFAIGGMLATLKAAPVMLSMKDAQTKSDAAVEEVFNAFHHWGDLRSVCQILTFLANVATLTLLGD
jgi:hypothetical protein